MLIQEARNLETILDRRLEEFTSRGRVPSPLEDLETGNDEQEIEHCLSKLETITERLEANASTVPARAQAQNLRKSLEEKRREFKIAKENLKKKRDSALLLKRAEQRAEGDVAAEMHLQKERNGISNATRAMNENIQRAMAVKDALQSQTDRLQRAGGQVIALGERIPGVNALINLASRKKLRDNAIVASFIALCFCLTFWFVL